MTDTELEPASQPRSGAGVTAALLDALDDEGELVEAGSSFSIDANRALAKLREFQLVDAHAYVLLLVEAAVLAGVETVEIEIDVAQVCVGLGSLSFDRDTLEQLFAAVFVELDGIDPGERRRRRALQKLALACNAALSLEPRAIELECTDGTGKGLRLTLTPGRASGEITELDSPPPSAIRIRSRALTEIVDDSREAQLIRERCRFSATPIFLDGERVGQPLERALHTTLSSGELSLGVRARKLRSIELDGVRIGAAALRYGGGLAPELRIVTNGVLAETLMLDELARPAAADFLAIVDLDLAKDLGQSKLLRGPAFDRVLDRVWAVHDEIAPPEPGERATARARRFDLGGLSAQAVLIPLAAMLFGLLILWASYDDGGVEGGILVMFSLALIAGSAIGLIRGILSARPRG